jgi:hypothetical protein
LTFQIVGWVNIFTRKIYLDIAIESFKYCQQKYSSARNYAELDSVIEILKLAMTWKTVK